MMRLPELLRDFVILAGAGLVLAGVWSIYQPAAWIVGGAVLVAVSLLHQLDTDRRKHANDVPPISRREYL